MIQAIHTTVQGRARFQVGGLYRSLGLQQYLEQQLRQQPGILSVSANTLTGTVLVKFEPDQTVTDLEQKITALVSEYQARPLVQAPEPPRRRQQSGAEQPQQDWHRMQPEAVLQALETDPQQGLTETVAQARLGLYGENRLARMGRRSDLAMVLEQFTTLPVALLSGASLLSAATGGLVDAAVIMGVVGINAVIGYVTESQSERIIQALRQTDHPMASVLRQGQLCTVPTTAVVPGDLLVLRSGNAVAADARLIQSDQLSLDESILTGESIPVSKQVAPLTAADIPLADRQNMVFQGTLVTGGSGLAVVVATGRFTEIGQIQTLVGETIATDTPLQKQLDTVGGQLVWLCSGVCVAIFGLGALRGYGLLELLKTSVSLAVAAVPEGLPTIATTTLALGIQDMRRRKILIRGLNAVEGLGSVQTICLDKTGTITANRMVVQELQVAQQGLQLHHQQLIAANGQPIQPQDSIALQKLLAVAVLCNESEIEPQADGRYQLRGSATETALVQMALDLGVDVGLLQTQYPRLQSYPRADHRNRMSTVHGTLGPGLWVAVKGSPEEVLAHCQSWLYQDHVTPLTATDRHTIALMNQHMAGKALRVLGLAYRELACPAPDPETNLVWLGLVGMADPIREGVPELMAQFHQAGIDTVMITGDQSPTAYAIGQQLRLSRGRPLEILEAADLSRIEPEALKALCRQVDIFARISPADKLQIVQALQAAQKIVAMTGDGVNDTPALKAANVGVAMGSGWSEGVHEVADVVIQDDDLKTLIEAVSRGRSIYQNIRKSVHFLLSTNLSEILVVALATALGVGEPMNAMQLLWLNLVTDVFPGLGLALEPPEPDVLNRPPRDPNEPIIKPTDFQRIALESVLLSIAALIAYGYGISRYGVGSRASTIVFMSLTVGQVLHAFSCRSEYRYWFSQKPLPRNPYVEAAVVGSLALQLLPLAIPGLGVLLKLAPIEGWDYGVIGLSALAPLLISELTKPAAPAVQASQPLL